MKASPAVLLVAALAASACSSATARSSVQPPARPAAAAPNPADVRFVTGMIPHHAQAVLMAGWAESHGARADIQILCERMKVAQGDEIELMRTWLADHGQPVPPPDATHMTMTMGGVEHRMLMPGMLTDEELAELNRARGSEWDRLFLTYMIRHHQGAITMVDELFNSYGAAQDHFIYRFASDVWADQTTEIERMQQLLAGMSAGGGDDR